MMIKRGIPNYFNVQVKEQVSIWRSKLNDIETLSEVFSSIQIPLLCVYDTQLYSDYTADSEEFKAKYKEEVALLRKSFAGKKEKAGINGSLETILILFPLPDKYEFIKRIHLKILSKKEEIKSRIDA